ncbi:MAG: type 4a pilus biogenesis protein PilO [Chitinispirillia bacterium]|nr:type 4a pilus biogenesis protein PilO [Chitinispirillia bacterium]MCL2268961.1 type 4a pilus biogenesis protein PilO [Chitinispirillia bacterium]
MAKSKSKLKIDLKDPGVRNVLASVFVIGVCVFFWFDSVYSPLAEEITRLEGEKERVEAELLKINALKPQIQRLRQESAALEAELDSLKNMFPDGKELPRLIRELTSVNRRSGVVTTRFMPKPDVVKEYYIENKYDVSITGDYHNIGALFSYMANFQLIINLANVNINANPNFGNDLTRGGGGGAVSVERQPSVNATFEMTTFSSKK